MKRSTSSSSRRPAPPDGHVVVGRVLGAWGIRGDLKVRPDTDVSDRFSTGNSVYLDGKVSRIERSRVSKGTVIVKLDVMGDRNDAEAVRGHLLTVLEDSLQTLQPGSYYHFHIIDMEVYDEHGVCVGNVKRILPTGDRDVYVVSGGPGGELLIPAVKDYILEVDIPANRMTVRLPEEA